MKRVEQAQLLAAMHAVEGVADFEHDALGHLPERGAILLDQRPAEAQQRPHCKSAPNRDPARDWSYHVDSIPIISVLVGSLSAPIGTLLFSGFSKSNQGRNLRWSGVPVRG